MKKIAAVCLAMSFLLCGCVSRSQPGVQAPPQEAADNIPASELAETEDLVGLRPYPNWVFPDDPYVLSGERYEALFSGGDAVQSVEEWFGVPRLFPFVGFEEIGIVEGREEWEEDGALCDEAWAIARRFYTAAIGYSAPDGTQYVVQGSNYPPSLRAAMLWNESDMERIFGGPAGPPVPYDQPIRIQAAVMNWHADGWLSGEDPAAYDQLPLAERTARQDQWMTKLGRDVPEWNIPEDQRYYAVTGLTILNGDSRTQAHYIAGSRAKHIRITINGDYEQQVCLADTPAPQLIGLDYRQESIRCPVDIRIEVLDAYQGQSGDIYITEIGVGIDSNLHQGI